MPKKWKDFEYKPAFFAISSFTVGIASYVLGYKTAGNWILGLSASMQVLPMAYEMIKNVFEGELGIDLLAVTAIATALRSSAARDRDRPTS